MSDDFQLTPPPAARGGADDVRTPMMRQYEAVKRRHPDAIVFFRMGDFFEMFGRDAEIAAPILEIALTTRDKKSANPLPMCGIPHHATDSYVGKLLRAGRRVVICDQVEDPRTARGLVRREVTRIITPGTLLEDNLLAPRENNFLCSVAAIGEEVGAAFVDLSTAEFFVTCHAGPDRWGGLADDLDLYNPRELIHAESATPPLPPRQAADVALVHGEESWWFSPDFAEETLERHFQVADLNAFGLDSPAMLAAAGAALQYLKEVQRADLKHIFEIRAVRETNWMVIDDVTRKNLELTASLMTGDKRNSLLSLLDRTQTAMGARLLRQWLLRPELDIAEIDARLDAVAELKSGSALRNSVGEPMRQVADIERLLTRAVMGSANARDLASLRRSFEMLPDLKSALCGAVSRRLSDLHGALDTLEDVAAGIEATLVEEPPLSLKDGGLIAVGADAELDELRSIVSDTRGYIADIEHRERGRTGIPNLKVKYNRVFGYYIEVSRSHLDLVPEDYFRKQTTVNSERFITPELKELESKVINAQDRIGALEYEIFSRLRGEVAAESERIKKTARILAQLDVHRCLAEVAAAYGYARPMVDESESIRITAGRHPVVEQLRLEERFIPNDAHLDTGDNRLLIITGPNMGGKSTYLRQVALIAILAQMGSFVPAAAAGVGLVDRIFTRIGAGDFLARGQSTFMVEMSETAHILRNATRRSLIILDEVGRGTSTFDGLSLAWAVAEFIHGNPRLGARTMFATHYHELTELDRTLEGVKNYNVAAREHGDEIIFLRTVVPGPSDQSYGIQVGKLAGLPRDVVRRAREILANLTAEAFDGNGRPKLARHEESPPAPSPADARDRERPHPALRELERLDVENLTPIEALNALARLKEKLNKPRE